MQRIVLFTLFLTLCSISATGSAATPACERLEQQRERIYQQMRRLHSAERGNQLRARLREINSKIAHGCR